MTLMENPAFLSAAVVGVATLLFLVWKTYSQPSSEPPKKLKGKEVIWESTSSLPVMKDQEEDIPEKKKYNRGGARRESIAGESVKEEDLMRAPSKIVIPKDDATRAIILGMIGKNLLFRNLDSSQKTDLVDAMFDKTVPQGENVITQGDEGDFFYLVQRGNFEILVNAKKVAEAGEGKAFGELALLYGQPRAATVRALEESHVWAVDRATFRRVVMSSNFRKRKQHEGFLKEVKIFSSLNPEELVKLTDALQPISYSAGDKIVSQGEQGETFYIIVEGVVSISKDGAEVTKLTKGDYFGEIALLTDGLRAATATAESATECLVLEKTAFTRLLGPCIDILKRNMENYQRIAPQLS